MNQNNNNELMLLGTGILILGLVLGSYSFSTYIETRELGQKIDFELIDDNNELSSTEKYYKYIAIADFLNHKLAQNKDILIKNSSCIYLDYAQHNAIELHRLTSQKFITDESKKSTSASNVRGLYNTLDNYKTCKKTPLYKAELENILDEIQNNKKRIINEEQMNRFLNGYKEKKAKELETKKTTTDEYQEDQPLPKLENIPDIEAEETIEKIRENSTSKLSDN